VQLGWGSLTHVLDARERERLLVACARLAPNGPILVSFLTQAFGAGDAGRAARLGARLGRGLAGPLARLRGAAPAAGQVAFGSWFGFAHLFAPGELEALARAAGRRLVHEPTTSYPHATLLPSG
jgi:hypothetical protein